MRNDLPLRPSQCDNRFVPASENKQSGICDD